MNNNFSIIWGRRLIKEPQLSCYLTSAIKQLKGMGLKPGDRVAICDENSVEYIILLLALLFIKVVAAPVSPRWPDKTISSYVAKINARHLFRSVDIKRAVCFDARQQTAPQHMQDLDPEQEATVIATSGSGGEAKAAVHTWGNHYYSARGSNEVIPLTAADRWLLSLPLYHVSGMAVLARCLYSGAGIVVGTDDDLAQSLERSAVTHVSLVSTQLHRLLSCPENLDRLR